MTVLCGIIGRPSVGKTTIFNLLTGAAFSRGVNQGSAKIPDERLEYLATIYEPSKTTFAALDMVDIPGFDNDEITEQNFKIFLEEVRKADALVHVVRAFKDESVWHVDGSIDIIRDLNTINSELILNDLELVETRIERIETSRQKGVPGNKTELSALLKCRKPRK